MHVKICGLSEPDTLRTAITAGARYIGFVFVPKSPRHVSMDTAADLAGRVPAGVAKVSLTVDADDSLLDDMIDQVPLDMLQLHGEETPQRVAEVKARYGLPVMKAIGIGDASDLDKIPLYAQVADQLLIDTKPPSKGDLPGGTGLSFDWRLLQGRRWAVPWMLAGGLSSSNVAEAIRLTGARQVDVSSGVESARGVKSSELIEDFMAAARNLGPVS